MRQKRVQKYGSLQARDNSKCIISLTKTTTLLSLKTDMFRQLQLPSSV